MKPKERKNTNSGYERLKIHPLEINNLSPGKFINITLTYLSLIDNLIDNIQYEIFQLSNDVIVERLNVRVQTIGNFIIIIFFLIFSTERKFL